MIRIFTLVLTALFISFTTLATVYNNNGTATNYNLNAGDSLTIRSGTYTGNITCWNAGAKIVVLNGASFKPASLSNYVFSLEVFGSATLPNFSTYTGFTLKNWGNVIVKNGFSQMAMSGQNYYNYYGATLTFKGPFAMNVNGGYFMNQGEVNFEADFAINSASSFMNRHIITVKGNTNLNNATFTNMGKFLTEGKLTFSQGTFTNSCRTIAERGIEINNTIIDNDGLIWASKKNNEASLTNSGTIIGRPNSQVKSKDLTNWGTIKGSGYFYFTGTTVGGGTIGVTGNTTDTLKFYDLTRTSPNTIFDSHNSNVRPNAKFVSMSAPDTVNLYPTCASEMIGIALPVKYNYFHVSLADNIPAITWSADHNENAVFTIERSYDGVNFSAIAIIFAGDNETKFSYNDKKVDATAKAVYYRIVGEEPNLVPKITETRIVKFATTTGITFQALPNPFTSQLNINYQSATRTAIQVSIYNMSGQVQVSKQITVSAGFNSIAVSEVSRLANGMYVIQVKDANGTASMERIIKQ